MIRILVLVLLAANTWAEDPGWETRLQKDGILVESRLEAGKSYKEFRAATEIDANIAAAIALLRDNSACVRWLFRCKESRLLEERSLTERTFYQVSSLPFPAKSRDAIFLANVSFDGRGAALIELDSIPLELPETKHIRIRDAHGSYHLEQIDEDRTRITWQQYIDPAGALPAWLVNSMLTDLPYKSLQSFRKVVMESPYRDAKVVNGPDGQPMDISISEDITDDITNE